MKDLADKIQMDLVDMGKYKTRTKDTIGFLQPLKSLVATRSQSQCIERISEGSKGITHYLGDKNRFDVSSEGPSSGISVSNN